MMAPRVGLGAERALSTMGKEIIVNIEQRERRIAVLEDKALEEFFFERADAERLTGNIYRGRVVAVMPGIEAAFVDIGLARNGFLHISDITGDANVLEEVAGEEVEEDVRPTRRRKGTIQEYVKVEDDLLVQVIKEPLGTKGPRLSTNLSLPGRFLVFLPKSGRSGISRRIEDAAERDRLKAIVRALPIPRGMGVIVRTAGQGAGKREFAKDIKALLDLWNDLSAETRKSAGPCCVHTETDLLRKVVRDAFNEDVQRIVVDCKAAYRDLRRYVGTFFPRGRSKVALYKDPEPIFEAFGVEKEVEKVFRKKVWLKCGGSIVIEKMEALVAIDVNTSRNVGKGDADETILQTNLEAAREAARQLRLRNLGGLIVIDFIDMRSRAHQRRVYEEFQRALARDKAKSYVLPISELGLVEMTRERTKRSLGEALTERCPYCDGSGAVKSPETVSIEIQRHLRALVARGERQDLKVAAHPDVIERLRTSHLSAVEETVRASRVSVDFLPVSGYHLEEWNCYPVVPGARGGEEVGR